MQTTAALPAGATANSSQFHMVLAMDDFTARRVQLVCNKHDVVISMSDCVGEQPLLFIEEKILRHLGAVNFCSRHPARNSLVRTLCRLGMGVTIDLADELDEAAFAFLAQLPRKLLIFRNRQKYSYWLSAFRGGVKLLRWMKAIQVQAVDADDLLALHRPLATQSSDDWKNVLREFLTADWESPVILFSAAPLAQRKLFSWLKSWVADREIGVLSVLPGSPHRRHPVRESLTRYCRRPRRRAGSSEMGYTLILNRAENLTSAEVDWLRDNRIPFILLVRNAWLWHDSDIGLATEAQQAAQARYVLI